MKRIMLVFMLLLSVGLGGCVKEEIVQNDVVTSFATIQDNAQLAYANFSGEAINASLETLAVSLAKVVNNDKAFKTFIGKEIGKKFDGDFDVLYERIADISVNDKTLRKELQKQLKNKNLNEVTSLIPYLHLAIPINYDSWSAYDGKIYVIPLRYDQDDLQITEYIGYDQYGNTRVFDAKVPPEEPVLILGINERIEHMMQDGKEKQYLPEITPQIDDGTVIHTEVLEELYMYESLDNWPNGAPEPYILYAVGDKDMSGKVSLFSSTLIDDWNKIRKTFVAIPNFPEYMQYVLLLREYDGTPHVTFNIYTTFYYDGLTRIIRAEFPTTFGIGSGDDNFYSHTLLVPFSHYDTNYTLSVDKAKIKLGYL